MNKINLSTSSFWLTDSGRRVGVYYGREAWQHVEGMVVGAENLKIPSHINLK